MKIKIIPVTPFAQNCSLLICEATQKAALVDPGGDIEKISQESGLSYFFMIFTIVPIVLGLISFALHPLLKKLMHGVE